MKSIPKYSFGFELRAIFTRSNRSLWIIIAIFEIPFPLAPLLSSARRNIDLPSSAINPSMTHREYLNSS